MVRFRDGTAICVAIRRHTFAPAEFHLINPQ